MGTKGYEGCAGLDRWSDNDPKEAAQNLSRIQDERVRDQAYASTAKSMANFNLPGAVTWADALPEGRARDQAISGVASVYAYKDPLKASEWLQGFDKGATRDRAVQSFASAIIQKDPYGAWEWAATIDDTNLRDQALEGVARQMLGQNREEAKAFIEKSGRLSEQSLWRLLEAN
jgi:hypothetical protein